MMHPLRVGESTWRMLFLAVLTLLCVAACGSAGAANDAPASSAKAAAEPSVKSIVWAEPAANAPNCIFQLGPLTCSTVGTTV